MHLAFLSSDIHYGISQQYFSTFLLAAVQRVWTDNLLSLFCSNSSPSLSSFLLQGCAALQVVYNTHGVILRARWMKDDMPDTYSSCAYMKHIVHNSKMYNKTREDVTPAVHVLFFLVHVTDHMIVNRSIYININNAFTKQILQTF